MSRYDDILNLPHPVSKRHPQMKATDRAAQFSPFAALTGYEAAVKETARSTTEKVELDENAKEALDRKLTFLKEHLSDRPEVSVTYFVPDEKKAGGRYTTAEGVLKKINEHERCLVLEGGEEIQIEAIFEITQDGV